MTIKQNKKKPQKKSLIATIYESKRKKNYDVSGQTL